jgi:methylated-DNA-[protein]-cysteine S-methyltransferase
MIDDSHLRSCPICCRRLERERELEIARRDRAEEDAAPDDVVYGAMWSPFGTLWIAAGPYGVIAVSYAVDELSFVHDVEQRTGQSPAWAPSRLADEMSLIGDYLAGRRKRIDLAADLRGLPALQRDVFAAVQRIPYGDVRTYGQVAETVGRPRAARAVGTAMAASPAAFVIPCHRVVRADGALGTYGMHTLFRCGPTYKGILLAHERT